MVRVWPTRSQTSYERTECAASSFRWPSTARSSSFAARCRSATATRGGGTSSREQPLSAIGHRRPTITRSSSQPAGNSAPRTSGSPTALQPTRLRLADEDQGDAREGDGARGDRRVAEPQGSTDAVWWTPMVGGHRAESVRLIARGSSPRSRQTVLLSGLPEPEAIRYRQAVLTDCLEHSAIVRQLYDLAVEALESKKRAQVFLFRDSPDALLQKSVRILELLADVLRRLRGLADEHAAAGYVARRAWLLHPQLAQQRAPLRVVLVVPYALGDEAHVRPVERGDDGSAGEDRVLDALPEPDGLRRVVHRGR